MKKLIIGLFISLLMATSAMADYTLIVPQKPGGGTSVWAEIIARNLSRFLDEPVVVRHIPGAKDIPGFNKFYTDLMNDDKVIMVSHGGNGISFLLDDVEYSYDGLSSIGMMNLDIVVGRKVDANGEWKYAGGSGSEPDGMAMAMMICGPQKTTGDILTCWNETMTWINGLSGSERRLMFMRGETNISRESPAAWKKFMEQLPENMVWFTHGVFDLALGRQVPDMNFPGTQFEDVYYKTWGVMPEGEFYESYKMMRNWRDVIQKALWVREGNPNTDKLRTAMKEMLADPEAVADIQRKAGNYEWIIGEDGDKVVDYLRTLITSASLQVAVWWTQNAYGFDTIFKPELAE